MKSEKKSLVQNQRTKKPEMWEYSTSQEAIKEFYGSLKHINSGINLEFPHSNHTAIINGNIYTIAGIRLKITSELDLESIGIFVDGNPRSAVSILVIPKNSIIDYEIPIKLKGDSLIIIIGKSRDGKLYKIFKRTKAYIHN